MPTYDYQCQACDHVFEKFHGMTEKPRVKCPLCGGKSKKLIGTGAGIIFKGKGFYATDYRSPEYKKELKKESSGESEKKSDGGKTKDSKDKAKKPKE